MSKLPSPGPDPYTYPGHSGIDFLRGKSGVPIRASGPGTVLRLSKNAAGGNWVVIAYDAGFTAGYAHMNSHTGCPRPGTRVSEGTVIGYVGSLGTRVTGPHVHVEVIGQATSAAVWAHFDRDRQIGQAAPASSGTTSGSFPARKLYGAGWVTFLQDLLTILGHDTGGRDGKDGAKTQAAVRHEQGCAKKNGYGTLTQDGVGGPATVTYLLWAIAKYRTKGEKTTGQPARTLYGQAWVKLIQRMLVELGHTLTVDGKDGAKTQAAVGHEQAAARRNGYGGVTVDRIAGFKTAAYLVWAIAKYRLPWT